jgi:hypothetical protein
MGLAPCSCDCDGEIVHDMQTATTAPNVPIADLRLIVSADRGLRSGVVEVSMRCSIGSFLIAVDGRVVAMVRSPTIEISMS